MTTQTAALVAYGWGPWFEESFRPFQESSEPARVLVEHRGSYVVHAGGGERIAALAGRLRQRSTERHELPAVGDWVALRREGSPALIEEVLPRRTAFVRKAAGAGASIQVVGANVDVVFVATTADDLNFRRIERYVVAARESGASFAVVVTKAELGPIEPDSLATLEGILPGCPLHRVSAFTGEGLESLREYFGEGRTVAVLGSSGVGKSTLINRLCGEDRLDVQATLGDGRGRHTSTRRELVPVPGGGLLLDTPGMRELALACGDDPLDATFGELGVLAQACRFRDCAHEREPGCAVQEALAAGTLDAARWASYQKLERELAAFALRTDRRAASERKKELRALARSARMRDRLRR